MGGHKSCPTCMRTAGKGKDVTEIKFRFFSSQQMHIASLPKEAGEPAQIPCLLVAVLLYLRV